MATENFSSHVIGRVLPEYFPALNNRTVHVSPAKWLIVLQSSYTLLRPVSIKWLRIFILHTLMMWGLTYVYMTAMYRL